MHWWLALALALLLPWSALAQQLQPVPTLTGPLIDQTGTLTEEQTQTLTEQLLEIEDTYGSQVVVLMVPTTAPEDIAPYANRVASTWRIGRKEVGDGVLVVIAKDDRRMRIEVARALEGAVPDLTASRIIDEQMTPHFRSGDFAGGIGAAVEALRARIAGEELPPPAQEGESTEEFDPLEMGLLLLCVAVFFVGPWVRLLFGSFLGSALTGAGLGYIAFLLLESTMLAWGWGVLGAFATFLTRGIDLRNAGGGGGGGGYYSSSDGGSWGGGSDGGYSSGGGGSFGGGGASGSW